MSQPATDKYPSNPAICFNCRMVLTRTDHFDPADNYLGTTYEHPLASIGHIDCPEVVPMYFTEGDRHPEQNSICDFCGALGVAWDYPTDDFSTPGDDELIMVGVWAACDLCHDDIEADRWDMVLKRWCMVNESVLDESAAAHLAGIYSEFRLNRQGAARPV